MMNISEKDLMLVFKGLINYLFFLIQVVIILLMKIHIKSIFFQELKQKMTISKLMVEIFTINQLMTQLNNMMDKTMIILLVVYQIFLILKKICRLIAADLSKKKALDADSRAIQQIIFTGKIKATEENTRVIIYYILEKSKETIVEFSKGATKVL